MAMNMIYNTNPLALPYSPKFNKQSLCKLNNYLHSKFVIFPADKAANNVIIIWWVFTVQTISQECSQTTSYCVYNKLSNESIADHFAECKNL